MLLVCESETAAVEFQNKPHKLSALDQSSLTSSSAIIPPLFWDIKFWHKCDTFQEYVKLKLHRQNLLVG